ECLTGLHRGDGRPGEERADGPDEPDHQQGTQRFLDEPDERVEYGGGGVTGQYCGRHGVQVDAAEEGPAEGQDRHGRGEAEPGSDQGTPVAPGDVHPQADQEQRQYRQHDLEIVDQPVAALRLDQVPGREQGQRRVDRGEAVHQREPARNQILLDDVDERGEVYHDLAVVHADRARLSGERVHELLVSNGVDLDPGSCETRARNDLVYLAVDEPGDGTGDRRAERLEQHADARQALA